MPIDWENISPKKDVNLGETPVREFGTTEEDVMISARGADPTHHIKLIDSEGSSVGFVISDQEGDLDERTFRRFPSSDPQNPYVTERQETFGSGFGQAIFEQNRAKYWRSEGLSTIKDSLVNGPMFHYGSGAMSWAVENMPDSSDSMAWARLKGVKAWMGMKFKPNADWTKTEYIKLWVRYSQGPPSLRVRIYTDEGNNQPTTLIHTEDTTRDALIDDFGFAEYEGRWIRIAVTDTYAYDADLNYWVVLTTTGPGNGYWDILGVYDSSGKKSTDGSTWSSGPSFYYRLEGDRVTGKHYFFEYKRQLYFGLQKDAYGASSIWMNGWRGVADTNSGNKGRLNDSTQDWSTGITGDEVVQMYAGNASQEQEDHRFVSSGANGYLVVDRNWQITHSDIDE